MLDEAGFNAWAREHQRRLLRTAFLVTGDPGRAEDLVQDALLKVALRWSSLGENRLGYARTIIYRDHISWWRRRRVTEHSVATPPDSATTDPSVEHRLVVTAALAKLSPRQRQVLVMRYFDDLSDADCAAVLGISIGTVKRTLFDARAALRNGAPELAHILTEV